MQPAPIRLQQAIWTAFRPVHTSVTHQSYIQPCLSRIQPFQRQRRLSPWQPSRLSHIRLYSDNKKSEIDRRIEAAQQRVDETIDSRADTVIRLPGPGQDTLNEKGDETIAHTLPESSSTVDNPNSPEETAAKATAESTTTEDVKADTSSESHSACSASTTAPYSDGPSRRKPLPSQLAARYSHLRERFTHFMDNFQTHVFTASKRLNDLTGYSSIEQLKRDIERQERAVRLARQHVRDSRDAYQKAIATRSDTQREVNDLLQRKHAWSPTDLERFANLYRSDHANEQAESQAHEELNRAEQTYEEESTRLSKSILARYHEEQVWSDKIRQMSTWGTWGLMGLNVLLFVVFQILVEPWRRRRLVRGFEEKVQKALKEQSAEQELRTIFHIERAREDSPATKTAVAAVTAVVAAPAEAASDEAAQKLADGTAAEPETMTTSTATDSPLIDEMAQRAPIEQAAEAVTAAEVVSEAQTQIDAPYSESGTGTAEEASATQISIDTNTQPESSPSLSPFSSVEYKEIPFLLGSYTRQYFDQANAQVQSLFDERKEVVLSQRDLTAKVLEAAFVGAVGVITLFWAMGISSVRGR